MIEGLQPPGQSDHAARVRRTLHRTEAVPVPGAAPAGGPSGRLPAEVLEALDNAQRVIAALESRQLHLRFSVDEATARVGAEVFDAEGIVVRRIPAYLALEILSGDRHASFGFDLVD